MAGSAFRLLVTFSNRALALKPLHPPSLTRKFTKSYFSTTSLFTRMSSSTVPLAQPVEEIKEEIEIPAVKDTSSEQNGKVEVKIENPTLTIKTELPAAPAESKQFVRIRKRKLILMLSYCGQEYYGMQRNPDTRTIEEELFKSMLKNGYLDDESFKKPQIVQFQRAARTDKHVSAARQIVSLKVDENLDISKINEFLPPEIRVMGMKRVTQGFDSKNNCDARTYMYMTPTFAFTPVDTLTTEEYRISPERLSELQACLDLYLGVKNFHNFTSRKRPHDPSAMRNIFSFTVGKPFIKDGLEYVILRVKGQSFMLHQIRKMIGLVMAYMRGFASLETFEKCWKADRIDIPKAPGVGLMLDYVHYQRYDTKYGSDGMHDPITWDNVEDEVQKFCDVFIYPVITKAENVDKSMMTWLQTLTYHTYDVREEKQAVFTPIGKAYLAVCHNQGIDPLISSADLGKHKKSQEGNDDEDEGDDDDAIQVKRAKIKVEIKEEVNN